MAIINLIISKLSTIKYKVINDKLVYVDNIVDTRTPATHKKTASINIVLNTSPPALKIKNTHTL